MRHALDLTIHHDRRLLGDLIVWMTWFHHADTIEDEPCLVITSARRTGVGRGRPCVVLLSNMWKYNNPKYLLRVCMEFVAELGWTDSMSNTMKVADIITDHFDDLTKIPPRPTDQDYIGADVVMTDEQGREQHFEIRDHH